MNQSSDDKTVMIRGNSAAMGDNGPGKSLPETPSPKQFGQYEIVRELGKGGMATVYLALDTKLERHVALKVPHKSVAADPEYMARFLREARSAATLFHPNICPVYEVGEIGGTPYLTMAYIEGKSLTDFIADEHPVPTKRIAAVIRKIAQAMELAHSRGIVHRDLKPSNIMIDSRREPMIMDFGLALRDDSKEDSRLTQDGLLIGTPIYMAPEVAKQGAGVSGPLTDIYSLGAILYEFLAGRPPYKGTVNAVLVQVMRGQPKPPSTHRADLDPQIEEICLRAMTKSPAERYQTMGEFASALRDYIQGSGSSSAIPAVEVVEVVEETKPDPVRTATPTERRMAAERQASQSGLRSGARIKKPVAASNSDTIKLVVALVGGCVLAIGVLIGVIYALKGGGAKVPTIVSDDSVQPKNSPTDQSPSVTPTSKDPDPPVPTPAPSVTDYPLVGPEGIKAGGKNFRIPSNFGLPTLRLTLVTKPLAGGKFAYFTNEIRIDGRLMDSHVGGNSLDDSVSKLPLQNTAVTYEIPVDWLGTLKEGRKIHVKFTSLVLEPPDGPSSRSANFTLHVVAPP